VLQGLTLRPLLLHLKLEDDGSVDREVRLARVESLRAALSAAAACPGAESAALVRHRYEFQLRRAEEEFARDGASVDDAALAEATDGSPSGAGIETRDDDAAVVRAATDAQRRHLMALRADGTIGDAAFQRVEEELDWAELDWAQLVRAG
jgi:CPA1 family monovalent cation:H+ antiporter